MNLQQFEQAILRAEELLSGEGAVRIVGEAMQDLVADIANRVIEQGKGADDQPFTPYSTKPVPAFLYYGRSRNQSGESRVRAAAKKKQGVSYRDFRQFNGLPVARKNFSFNNEMWRHFGVKSVRRRGGVVTTTIGGQNAQAANKIQWLSDQERRSIIAPTARELVRVQSNIIAAIRQATGL